MKTILRYLIIIFILGFSYSCTKKEKRQSGILNPETVLTEDIGGFSRTDTVRVFGKDDLWKFNDGAADKFINLGFEKLGVADYSRDSIELTAEIYVFASADGVSKIYADNKASDERIVQIGDEGFITPDMLFFHWDNIHVQVSCYNPGAGDTPLLQFGRELAKVIEKSAQK